MWALSQKKKKKEKKKKKKERLVWVNNNCQKCRGE
jgi:hypothetical protein